MTNQNKCPKCGAEKLDTDAIINGVITDYGCKSVFLRFDNGKTRFDQSVNCLTTELAIVKAENERLKAGMKEAVKEADSILRHIRKEVLASDYNEHWESFKRLDAWCNQPSQERTGE